MIGYRFKHLCLQLLVASIAFGASGQAASAAFIGIEAVIAAQARDVSIQRINTILMRDDVQAQFVALGVDPTDAMKRVDALTTEELAQLEARLADLPAGGVGLIEVVGIVAIVLFVLEFLGVTDVFKSM